MNSVIILAGGNGSRANLDVPKQFIKINNSYIVDFSISFFKKKQKITEIILVAPEKWVDILNKINTDIKVVAGGNSRMESSFIGLQNCSKKNDNVLIHDAARPFVSDKIIDDVISNLNYFDSVVPVISCNDSILKIDKESFKYLDRDKIKYLQTPQGFKFDLLYEAYKNLIKSNTKFSDDLSLLKNFKSDISCKFVDGDYSNFKITTKNDIELAKILLK